MIKTAKDVKRAVLIVITIPMLGHIYDIVEVVIADPDPKTNSVIFKKTFFSFEDLYFFF